MTFKCPFQPKLFYDSMVVRLQLSLSGCRARPVLHRPWYLLPCPAFMAFPGQDEGKRVYGLQWGNVLGLAF